MTGVDSVVRLVGFGAIFLALYGCARGPVRPPEGSVVLETVRVDQELGGRDAVSAEERQVYRDFLDFAVGRDLERIVLGERTTDNRGRAGRAAQAAAARRHAELLGVGSSCVESYLQRNYRDWGVVAALNTRIPTVLVSEMEMAEMFVTNELEAGWDRFYVRYPKSPGQIVVSGVGFCDDEREAFLYVQLACGAACGWGQYFHLVRERDGWRVDGASNDWTPSVYDQNATIE